jgi:hypothetical protein
MDDEPARPETLRQCRNLGQPVSSARHSLPVQAALASPEGSARYALLMSGPHLCIARGWFGRS